MICIIYKERYEEEKDALNKKDTQKIDYTKLRLADVYLYDSEEEDKQTDKQTDKKEPPKKATIIDAKEFSKLIPREETGMNRKLFRKYFNFQMPTAMLKVVHNTVDKKKNNELINVIENGLSDFKDKIKEIPKDKIEIEKAHKIVDIIESILHFNRQNQEGQRLKIVTPDQMLSRLPITLAKLQAGNNLEKLKNEIRHLSIVQRSYPKQFIIIWSILFKTGNKLYEHRKQ